MTAQDLQEIKVEVTVDVRENDTVESEAIIKALKKRGIKPTVDLIEEILSL